MRRAFVCAVTAGAVLAGGLGARAANGQFTGSFIGRIVTVGPRAQISAVSAP